MTIVGGVNDVIGRRCDFAALRTDFAAMFGRAQERDIAVLTFTMPDPTAVNPLGRRLRERMFRLNDVIRAEAARYDAAVVDFQAYPVAADPRLWFEDRLHGNAEGHERVAAALAWRLGIAGTDDSWADPLPDSPVRGAREQIIADFDWAVNYLTPWLGKGVRGIPQSQGIVAKRPVPTVVQRSRM